MNYEMNFDTTSNNLGSTMGVQSDSPRYNGYSIVFRTILHVRVDQIDSYTDCQR